MENIPEIDWLATYAAIVGTLALLLNFLRFKHQSTKDKVKLNFSVNDHKDKEETIESMAIPAESLAPGTEMQIGSVYEVTIRNTGSVNAFIQDAGVIDEKGIKHSALTHYLLAGGYVLGKIADVDEGPLVPKSSRSYDVHLRRGENVFQARRVFVVDGTGKEWSKKVRI